MPFLPRALLVLGTILLIHACYSAHEHASLSPSSSTSSTTTSPASLTLPAAKITAGNPLLSSSLPLDISLETLASVFCICVALVLGAEDLKPIAWREWARGVQARGEGGFEKLEFGKRVGFLDIRAQRKEFADWVRAGAKDN